MARRELEEDLFSIYNFVKVRELTKEANYDERSIVPLAKHYVFGKKVQKTTYEENCEVLDYIIKQIIKIDEQDFFNLWSTYTLKELRIKNLCNAIIKEAPLDIQINCLWNNKRILFASVYPEFYAQQFDPVSYKSVYYCKGEVKSSLKKVASIRLDSLRNGEEKDEETKDGNYKKERNINTDSIHGAAVDELVYNTLVEYLDAIGCEDFVSQMNFLANIKSHYSKRKESLPGIYSIIDARGNYASYLDFYFMNSAESLQKKYFLDYYDLREQTQGYDPFVSAMKEVYLDYELD